MSTYNAIAAVTFMFKSMVLEGLVSAGLDTVADEVFCLPLDLVQGNIEKPNVNVFMYRAVQNAAWRNMNFPSHSTQGHRVDKPMLTLDLHYVITASAKKDLLSDMLLGCAMQVFHERPVLDRAVINAQLAGLTTAPLNLIGISQLADQFEQIRTIPDVLSTEEVSRIWATFGTKYRQSAFYKTTVVLIESDLPTQEALPVLHDPLIFVYPSTGPEISEIGSIATDDPSGQYPADARIDYRQQILRNYPLVIDGSNLRGEVTYVVIAGVDIAIPDAKNDRIICAIPTTLYPGIQTLQVVHELMLGEPAMPHKGFTSNTSSLVLSPYISEVSLVADTISMTISPGIGGKQKVMLLLNENASIGAKAISVEHQLPKALDGSPLDIPAGPLSILIAGVPSGDYWLRLSVDGFISPIAKEANGARTIISI